MNIIQKLVEKCQMLLKIVIIANEAGTCLEFTFKEKLNEITSVKNISLILFILTLNKINNYKTY